jgi:molybdate transport system substrate-binding protein
MPDGQRWTPPRRATLALACRTLACRTLLCACLALLSPAGTGVAFAQAQITLFAAASLKGALDESATAFRSGGKPGVRISYGGSLTLARQIELGAPADIFCAADEESMDYAAGRKALRADSRFALATNALVIVAPRDAPFESLALEPAALLQALNGGRLSTGDPAAAPVGRYAKEALEKLGLWSTLAGRMAFSENVRAALLFVSRGEAPLGLVYASDSLAEPAVKTVARLPASSHAPIVYPCALTTHARPAAVDLMAFLRTGQAQAILEKHGFMPAR